MTGAPWVTRAPAMMKKTRQDAYASSSTTRE